jgi:hypothetical protein
LFFQQNETQQKMAAVRKSHLTFYFLQLSNKKNPKQKLAPSLIQKWVAVG